tara:strand:- start:1065 stop:1457 length:393 start_codon:yes stop_codon:yes gene_type:complete
MKIYLFILLVFFPSLVLSDDLTGKKILCEEFLWGFDFISSNQVKAITTDYNKVSIVKDYYYSADDYLPYINIYETNNINNANFSINRQTLRVDIWTMTAGGYTSREIIPEGFCKDVKINNIENYIKDLKK